MNDFNINNFDDQLTWDLISEGRTKGVFQLESQLGSSWAKKVKPRSITELSALISLIRPGCLKAIMDGKSMTQTYVDRKSGKEPAKYHHPSLESTLSETYGVLVYQEQSMLIAKVLSGFDLKEADSLRKAIGKKRADLMAKVKKSFIEGAESQGVVTKEIAEEIFSWIEKSSRYAFNKSHGIAYAVNTYQSAYCKAHKTLKFFEVYLNHAKDKDDLKEFVMDAKNHGIEVYPPSLSRLFPNFTMNKDKNVIYFGISHAKNVSAVDVQVIEKLGKTRDIESFTWLDCLFTFGGVKQGEKLGKRTIESLISIGGFNGKNNKIQRNKMLYEFGVWNSLTASSRKHIVNLHKDFAGAFDDLASWISLALDYKYISGKDGEIKYVPKEGTSGRLIVQPNKVPEFLDLVESLKNSPYSTDDHAWTIANLENRIIGCSLTCSVVDGSIKGNSAKNMCRDVQNSTIIGKTSIAVSIASIREYETKKGKNAGSVMAFLSVEDSSGSLDVTAFPEDYSKHKNLLTEGNTVLINGTVSSRDGNSLILNKVSQI